MLDHRRPLRPRRRPPADRRGLGADPRMARASAWSAATAPASRTLFNVITGDHRRRARRHRAAAALADRAARAGSARRPGKPDRGRARAPTTSAPRLLAEAETATDPHRIAEIQTRLADIGAYAAPARAASILSGLGFSRGRSGAPLLRILRRLAHARRARRDAVLRARPAAARRADQLSRSRRHALAAGPSGALSAHRDRDQPRPRPARHRGRLDPVAGEPASSRSIAAAIARSSACAASA